MKEIEDKCKIAVVQTGPVQFDKNKTLKKIIKIIEKSSKKADLIIFPELIIPGYPYGLTYGFKVGSRNEEGREDWKQYYDNSILAEGKEMKQIIETAEKHNVYISIGYSEKDQYNATLYNSNMLIAPDGEHKNHRKLKPTGSERVVWADANKDYFPTLQTPWGPIGSMICWESYMPLARQALYQKGITIYIAPNTNDNPEWQNTIKHIAIEGHCYLVNCDMYLDKKEYPKTLNAQDEIEKLPDTVIRGGSSIIDPYGHEITKPVWDKEEIIYTTLDMQQVPASRMEFDATGHYSRQDVFNYQYKDI